LVGIPENQFGYINVFRHFHLKSQFTGEVFATSAWKLR